MNEEDTYDGLKKAISEHDAKVEEIEKAARTICFDKWIFFQRLKNGDDWQRLIQAHIYLEYVASKILTAELPNSDEINLSRMGFSARLNLISALGVVPIEFISTIRSVSRMRNKVAHELNFEISEQEVVDLRNALPKFLRDVAEEPNNRDYDGPLRLEELLKAIPLFFEMYRQERAVVNSLRAHREKRMTLAQEMARLVIKKIDSKLEKH